MADFYAQGELVQGFQILVRDWAGPGEYSCEIPLGYGTAGMWNMERAPK